MENIIANIQSVLSAVNKDPAASMNLYHSLSNVLFDQFHTDIAFFGNEVNLFESVPLDKTFDTIYRIVTEKYIEANKTSWHLDETVFETALDNMLNEIKIEVSTNYSTAVYIYCSTSIPSDTNRSIYGMYVNIVRLDGSSTTFDLIQVYHSLLLDKNK